MRKRLLFSLMALILLNLACKKKEEKKEIIRPVKTIVVGDIQQLINTEFPGITQELKSVDLAFRVGGPLTYFNAVEGMQVKRGQVIAEVDARDFRVDLTAREARFIQTRAEKERYERLLAKQSVSKNEYDQRLAIYLEAKAAYKAAKNALVDTKLRAPFNAFIDQKFVENYERIHTGQTIVSLLDLSAIEVKFTVPELLAVQFRNFKDFTVFFDIFKDVPFKANFKEIGKKSESSAGIPITLVLEHKNSPDSEYKIIPGVSCKVKVNLQEEGTTIEEESAAISVPVTAVFEQPDSDKKFVFVVDKTAMTASKREVTVGTMFSSNLIWITGGLKRGETLVTAGAARLQDGQKIKFLN
ncbi:efflux RND transporter periplasmic adaptor subunit [Marinilabiliaceae bacterium JC017]|nr:efflux RND transporter periplasmic adaptor subunit [Marinilabiliaceae bacterium JC017]